MSIAAGGSPWGRADIIHDGLMLPARLSRHGHVVLSSIFSRLCEDCMLHVVEPRFGAFAPR